MRVKKVDDQVEKRGYFSGTHREKPDAGENEREERSHSLKLVKEKKNRCKKRAKIEP